MKGRKERLLKPTEGGCVMAYTLAEQDTVVKVLPVHGFIVGINAIILKTSFSESLKFSSLNIFSCEFIYSVEGLSGHC